MTVLVQPLVLEHGELIEPVLDVPNRKVDAREVQPTAGIQPGLQLDLEHARGQHERVRGNSEDAATFLDLRNELGQGVNVRRVLA